MSRGEPVEFVAELALSNISPIAIAEGLRAAAEDSSNSRITKSLQTIADAMDRGVPVEQALRQVESEVAQPILRVLSASITSANIGWAVSEIGEHRRRNREMWRTITMALAYPAIVTAFAFGIYVFLMLDVVPHFKKMFEEFELKLPLPTELLIVWSDRGVPILLTSLAILAALFLLAWLVLPRFLFRFLLTTIPAFGRLWSWSGVADWSRWMSILLSERTSLVEALKLAAEGSTDASVSRVSSRVASRVESGVSLSDALWAEPRIPPSVIPFVISGLRNNSLPESFRTISELLEERVRGRAKLIAQTIPPIVLVMVGSAVVGLIPALFMPLVSLVVGLS